MRLLVLAGGFGTRLQSVLAGTPKALAPVGKTPFLELQLENWISQGVSSFVFLLHYQADQIISFLEASKNGIVGNSEVVSLIEPSPLDTGGAVAFAVRELGMKDDFLVTNADSWLSLGIQELMVSSSPTIAVLRQENASRYGQVEFDEHYKVTAFIEKNSRDASGWINGGLYRLPAGMFEGWDGSRFSLEKKTFPELVQNGELGVVAIEPDFMDIGIPEDYQRFSRWIEAGRKGALCK